jgi:RNA polymerase sigma-70 factor, ECF subfamily
MAAAAYITGQMAGPQSWALEAAGGRLAVAGRTLDSDFAVVQRCAEGDESAWEELVRTHTRRVYALCYRFSGKDAEAQDLAQEVFLRVFRTLKSFRASEGSFVVWLSRVTRNLLIDHYRRSRQERVTDTIEDQVLVSEETTAAPDRVLAGRETSEILQRGLQKLSPDLREAVILRDLQDMEYREIAQVLRIPEGTVKSRINRGRAELARVLRKQRVAI